MTAARTEITLKSHDFLPVFLFVTGVIFFFNILNKDMDIGHIHTGSLFHFTDDRFLDIGCHLRNIEAEPEYNFDLDLDIAVFTERNSDIAGLHPAAADDLCDIIDQSMTGEP